MMFFAGKRSEQIILKIFDTFDGGGGSFGNLIRNVSILLAGLYATARDKCPPNRKRICRGFSFIQLTTATKTNGIHSRNHLSHSNLHFSPLLMKHLPIGCGCSGLGERQGRKRTDSLPMLKREIY
jgi:hypothetical protein